MLEITRRHWLASLLATPALRLAAQQGTTFSTDVKVVNIFATVRNKKNELVRNLTKDDFRLEEDGRPQSIQYFAQETDLPLTLGLMVDTSESERRMLGAERSASHRFIEQVLRPEKDLAFVIHFDREVELLQDLTASREKLDKAINLLEVARPSLDSQRQGGGQPGGGQQGGGYPGGGRRGGGYPGGGQQGGGRRRAGTLLYDAIDLACEDVLKQQSGRKALVLLSDGQDHGSKYSLATAISAAHRHDTIIYSILFADKDGGRSPMMPGGRGRRGGMGGGRRPMPTQDRPDGKKILQQLSRETGGGFFEVTKKEPIEKVFEQIQNELRHQYSLGYTSDSKDAASGFRTVHVTTRDKALIVQARSGYYPR